MGDEDVLVERIREWMAQDSWFSEARLMGIHFNVFKSLGDFSLKKPELIAKLTRDSKTTQGMLNSPEITIGQVRKLLDFLELDCAPGKKKGELLDILWDISGEASGKEVDDEVGTP